MFHCFIAFYFIYLFYVLHFPLSGPVLTYISLLIIPCMIVYVTNNKEPWTLRTLNLDYSPNGIPRPQKSKNTEKLNKNVQQLKMKYKNTIESR